MVLGSKSKFPEINDAHQRQVSNLFNIVDIADWPRYQLASPPTRSSWKKLTQAPSNISFALYTDRMCRHSLGSGTVASRSQSASTSLETSSTWKRSGMPCLAHQDQAVRSMHENWKVIVGKDWVLRPGCLGLEKRIVGDHLVIRLNVGGRSKGWRRLLTNIMCSQDGSCRALRRARVITTIYDSTRDKPCGRVVGPAGPASAVI